MKVSYRLRINRLGIHLVRYTRYPLSGQGICIRSLVRWGDDG